ncbi:MAG TPA: GntR family transcriptional regulator [Actinomycetes bacterium]|nr:GntR family transcriptional regulator [Actinomycetes bacterium]
MSSAQRTVTPPRFDSRDGAPVHEQIERWFHDAFATGAFRSGDRLPPERELAAHLGVSRMTLRQALASLEGRGLVVRRLGRAGGTYVGSPRVVECDLASVTGFSEQMRRSGMAPGARVLAAERVRAPREVAQALGLSTGTSTLRVRRVRSADGEPVALEESWFPGRLFPDLLDRDLEGSLYALLASDWGRHPVRLRETLEPVIAGDADCALLGTPPGAPLMLVTRVALDATGTPVEFARDLFRADRTRLVLWTAEVSG